MFDEQDGDTETVADRVDTVQQILGFGGVHAGGRLVEQQQFHAGGQGACDLELALLAVRQVGRLGGGQSLEVEDAQQVDGLLVHLVLLLPEARGAEDGAAHVVGERLIEGDEHVLGDEKTKQWLEYNLSLIPKTIEQSRAYVAARGAKILSYSITINGYDSMSSVMCTQDEVDPGTEKARKELEERLEKRKAEKKETEERLEKQRAEKQEQEERQYNLKIDGKDVADLTGKMVELVGTSIPIGVTESGVSTFDVLA